MTAKACRGKNTPRPFTNGDFSQTFDRQRAGFPRGIGCHRVPDFIPPMARSIHNNINSKEVCRVFVLRCQLHVLSCSIESPVICNLYGRSSHSHTFIHSCIHTSILSYTHTFKHTQRTHAHTISIHTWLHQSSRVLFGHVSSIQSSFLPSGKSYITDNLRFIFVFLPSGKSYITDNLRCLSSKW